MSVREVIALGTGSQVPTRLRNHNGYLLRWDDEGLLFDPGEGTQRQMAHATLAASAIHRVCVTHFHGDHCLGLGGILQRISLDRVSHPVHVHYPRSGQRYYENLRDASIYYRACEPTPCPIDDVSSGLQIIAQTANYTLFAHVLEHSVPTVGYRLQEHDGFTFDRDKLDAIGLRGPGVGQLARDGQVVHGGRTVTREEVSTVRKGSVVAFVMDTRPCEGAIALARDADLLVMEATYTAADQSLATEHFHSSATDAARVALEAGARQLAITHFSQRYANTDEHLRDARALFANTVALEDFDRVRVARRLHG
ncbi:MAG: ribonuclease Z [Deltaproteobacteria bacterium]|nr:ribonuclease Z [Deltaproteobacteria bacterium]